MVEAQDLSDGCGKKFSVIVVSPQFEGTLGVLVRKSSWRRKEPFRETAGSKLVLGQGNDPDSCASDEDVDRGTVRKEKG